MAEDFTTMTVGELIARFERRDHSESEWGSLTAVLWDILFVAEDYYESEDFLLNTVLSIALTGLASNFHDNEEASVSDLIEEIGWLAGHVSGLEVSDATRQRLSAIVADSGVGDEPAGPNEATSTESMEASNG